MKHSRIIVVGGGHAGVEAASAACRCGAEVELVTMSRAAIGVMSCNPAIGGLGKGHLVREIDAMGGVMGQAADRAGIQYRLLNRSKGPAVQGPRAQMDRAHYKSAVQMAVEQLGIDVIEAQVLDVIFSRGRVRGVVTDRAGWRHADAVILTTGTFLNGVIHVGEETRPGGRVGEAAASDLARRLYDIALPMGRLKTGTPPRLDGGSIDWSRLEMQPGDDDPVMLSFLSGKPTHPQIACGITHTNRRTHDIIRENLHRSAMYSGNIKGIGPRYCPSIEDKIGRFADKDSHQIFLEPEGLKDGTVYPNGISTSLPEKVQDDYVRSITGLEEAVIRQPGYAIEYDFVDPRALDESLQIRALPGLWLAGQINGTTGYEEAAAQGLVAGIAASRAGRGLSPIRFSRTNSYIGVMIDDLVTRGVTEPYRMFTSRAEFRLSLRADNADQRLTPLAIELGMIDESRRVSFADKVRHLDQARQLLMSRKIAAKAARSAGIDVAKSGAKRSAYDLLAIPRVNCAQVFPLVPELAEVPAAIRAQIEREALYANYLDRQEKEAERLRRDEEIRIPGTFDFETVRGLSAELREKLMRVQPRSVAAAAKIEGMTPAALNAVILGLRSHRKAVRSA